MKYIPVNFVVLRSSGLPNELIDQFNFSKEFINEITNLDRFNEDISKRIDKQMTIFKIRIVDLLNEPSLRDMVRISTSNYELFMKKILNSDSLLSQYHRKILLYLQRGTSKCCTAGFYGPVAIGKFEHSGKNLDFFNEKKESFIMIEDWALRLLLKNLEININQTKHHKIIENYHILKQFKNKKLDSLVATLDEYKKNLNPNYRDELFIKLNLLFNEITNSEKKKTNHKKAKDYESRSIFYELGKRGISFQIGQDLKKDLDLINNILSIYLTLLTKKLLENIKNDVNLKEENQIADYVFKNFHAVSESVIKDILNNKINSLKKIDYPFTLMPPVFSPDITILSKSLNHLNNGEYKLVVGEIHVSATIISNPMYEFQREALVDELVSAFKRITNNRIKFSGYKIINNLDFTHNLPICLQEEVIKKVNKTANNLIKIYAYRSNKYLAKREQIDNLLFFPLAIGRKLVFNYHKDDVWGMWARNYIPSVLKRITKELFPKLYEKIILRPEKKVYPPKIKLPKKITSRFIFDMMKEILRWRLTNNFSDEVFVRYLPTKKPIYVNFNNPFLVYELIKLSKLSKNLFISEFSPNKDYQWLCDKKGHYSSEFRYMVFPCVEHEANISSEDHLNLIYLPGYKSRLDELVWIKKELKKSKINIESLIIDYNQNFEELSKKLANYIDKKYDKFFIMGLSIGGVLAIKIANILNKKTRAVFSLNAFYDRKKILNNHKHLKSLENIRVKDFIPNNVKIVLISSMKDNKIKPQNSKKIKELSKGTIFLHEIPKSDHIFSSIKSQKKVANIIKQYLT